MTVPFPTAEAAWFWAMSPDGPAVCEPQDITHILDTLYRCHHITLSHARILRVWGKRQIAPSANKTGERADRHVWDEALDKLDWPLRVKGIVESPRSI